MEEKIVTVLNEMAAYLSIAQMKKLQEVIVKAFAENEAVKENTSNEEYLSMFLAAKQIEGCSVRTIQYYKVSNFCRYVRYRYRCSAGFESCIF